MGIGPAGEHPGFQLSQRADYIEVEVGLETTLKRGIINTRDEPHADADKYRRLHVIIGDANLAEYSTYLKLGTTALVLDLIEAGERFDDLRLVDAVRAVHTISRDPSLKATVEVAGGRHLTGLDLQRSYHERVAAFVKTLGFVNSAPGFTQQPQVLNGFADLIVDLYGEERGLHARSAVGMAELPFDIPVEIETIVEVAP